MFRFIYSLSWADYLVLSLFLLHTTPFFRIAVNDDILTVVSSSMMTLIYLIESRGKERPLLQIMIVLTCFLLNYFINDCGLGAIIGCWEVFVFLMLCPHLKLSPILFKTLFVVCLVLLISYIIWLITHPSLYTYNAMINSNQVGLFAFYMASLATSFCPNYNKKNLLFLTIVQFLAFVFISTSECRSAQLALLLPLSVTLLMLLSKKELIGSLCKILKRFYPLFVWGGIAIVLLSLIDLSQLESIIGDFSKFIGNRKGSTLSLRGNIWKEGLGYFFDSPFIGMGSHIKLHSFKSLAFHSSAMNILVIFGGFIFVLFYTKIHNLLRYISCYLYVETSVFMSLVVFLGVLVTSYVESSLMDYFRFYSFLPLFYAFSRINDFEENQVFS